VIALLPGKSTMKLLEEKGSIEIEVDGEKFTLEKIDLIVETVQPEGLSTQTEREYTVSLDTTLTEELIEEGFVREIVSKVQTQRKESGFEVTDRIILRYSGNDKISAIMHSHRDFIASEVLASDIMDGSGGNVREWDINGEKCAFSIEKDN
jgi:isoleucyl-tRNA synthetase